MLQCQRQRRFIKFRPDKAAPPAMPLLQVNSACAPRAAEECSTPITLHAIDFPADRSTAATLLLNQRCRTVRTQALWRFGSVPGYSGSVSVIHSSDSRQPPVPLVGCQSCGRIYLALILRVECITRLADADECVPFVLAPAAPG